MKSLSTIMFSRALLGTLALAGAGFANAAYPERPITIVVPYAPAVGR